MSEPGLLGGVGALELRRRLLARELSCQELADELLRAIGGDPFGAWVAVDPELIGARAAELDALPAGTRASLPMFGVPVAIKDNFDTADQPTAYGSPIYAGYRPSVDAAAVQRFRSAGALIAGKVGCAEFAFMTPGPERTRNPLDSSRTPGGSSSGSAAAVAARTVPLATGTQTAGSIIRPASYCGIFGYKPSFGLLDRAGVKQLSATLDTVGLLGREVADLRLASLALGAPAPSSRAEGKIHIGFARTELWARVEADAAAAIEAWTAGHELVEIELPGYADLASAQTTIQLYETARSLAREPRERLSGELREALAHGDAITDREYERALAAVPKFAGPLLEQLESCDAVLTPSATGVPPLGLAFTGDPLFCRAWTLLGAPTLAVPIAWTPQGLPVGLQLAAAPGKDDVVFAAGEHLVRP